MIDSPSSPAVGPERPQVAVAAPHGVAVDAAREVVEAGGGAVDAALAAAMALTVAYPHQCSLGGDLFAVVRRPDGSTTCIDASGRYGSGGLPPGGRVPLTGPFSVTVPGVVSGWAALHGQGAALPVDRLLEPAVRLARDGVPVTSRLAAAIAALDLDADGDPGLRALVGDTTGRRLATGAVLRQEALAASLAVLAREGLRSFYDGSLGDDVAEGLGRLGVPVTRQDLQEHTVIVREPLTTEVAGCRLSTAPPPSQGYLLLTTMLAADRLVDLGVELGPAALRELFALTAERRSAELGDPDHMPVTAAGLLDERHVEHDVSAVVQRLRAPERPAPQRAGRDGDTVAVTAVGTDGTAVSLIQSLFHYFGARVHDPATGITFHNRASGFSAEEAGPNVLAPGRRPAHTLMPLLVEHPDGWIAAHGAMGGRQQPQIHAQVLRRRLAGATAAGAVSAPRFVVGAIDEAGTYGVLAEPDLGDRALSALTAGRLPVRVTSRLDEGVGHAMVCTVQPDGTLDAGADPRSDGSTWQGGPAAR